MSAAEYYNHTTFPVANAAGSSAGMRAELELIEAGFGKLPDLSGNGGKIVAVNSGGTGMEAVTTTGTGDAVRANSPTLVDPTLGTPASGTLTNCTGYPAAQQTIVQVVEATPYTTYSSHTATIPSDDTIPQNTEGDQILSYAFTAVGSGVNLMEIDVEFDLVAAATASAVLALFSSLSANALVATKVSVNTTGTNARLRYRGTAVTGTYSVRVGTVTGGGGTAYVNGNSSNRLFGGISAVRMQITEIKV